MNAIYNSGVAVAKGAVRSGWQSAGGGKNGDDNSKTGDNGKNEGDKGDQASHDFWREQNCSPPRAPLILATLIVNSAS